MAKFNKKKFLQSELGGMWIETVRAWDFYLSEHDDKETYSLQAKHEGIQTAVKQFYGIEYHFTRTDDYYGLVTEDYEDWLYRVEKENK